MSDITIAVATLPNEAQAVVDQYVERFGLTSVPLVERGIGGRIRKCSTDTSVGLVILTEQLYETVIEKLPSLENDNQLAEKLFIYKGSIDKLNEFLASMLGEDLNTSMSRGSIDVSAIDVSTDNEVAEEVEEQPRGTEEAPVEIIESSQTTEVSVDEERGTSETEPIASVTEEPVENTEVHSSEGVSTEAKNGAFSEAEPTSQGGIDTPISSEITASEENIISDGIIVENKRLKDELATKELLVRNLMQQVEDNNAGTDTSSLVETIRQLRDDIVVRDNQIVDLKAQLASSSTEDTTELNKQLTDSQTAYIQLDFDFKKLKSSAEADREQLKALQGAKVIADTELKKEKERVSALTEELKNLNERVKTLSEDNAELDVLRARVADFERSEGTHQAEKVALKDANLRVDNLTIELKNKDDTIASLNDKIAKGKESAEALGTQIADLTTAKKKAEEDLATAQNQIASLNEQCTEKTNQINELKGTIATATNEKNDLQSTLNSKQTDMDNLSSQLDEITSQKNVLEKQVSDLNDQLASAKEKGKETSESLESQMKTLKADKQNLESQLLAKDGQIKNDDVKIEKLNEMVESLNSQIKALGNQLADANAKVLDSVNKVDDYDNLSLEVERLKGELASKDATRNADSVQITAELANVKNQLEQKDSIIDSLTTDKSNLEMELEKAKNELNSKTASNSDVSAEISNLQHQLTEANSELAKLKVDSSNDNTSLTKKVDELTSANSDLESKLGRSNTEIEELRNKLSQSKGVSSSKFASFDRMSGMKSANSYKLDSIDTLRGNNFMVVASGSGESVREVSNQIAKTLVSQPSNHFVIIDVSSDSNIDITLNCSSVKPMSDWLVTGQGNLKDYVSRSKVYKNVVLFSTSLTYTNDLGFLTIDWDARLNTIYSMFGSNVKYIINVGNLNSLTAKILFNNFARVMPSTVLIKATPYNLRTMLLLLAGLNSLSKTKVEFIGYSQSQSKVTDMFVTTVKQKYTAENITNNGLPI